MLSRYSVATAVADARTTSAGRSTSLPARTNDAARRRTSHSKGPGLVSSKSLMSKMMLRSGAANIPKFDRWASPQSCVMRPLFGLAARSQAITAALPR